MKVSVGKSVVACVGLAGICGLAYALKEPSVLWSLILLIFLVEEID